MLQAFITSVKFVGLFVLWAVLGAASYLLVSSFLGEENANAAHVNHSASSGPVPILEDRNLEASTVEFARAENPVDLAFDQAGNGYVLDHNGKVLRVAHHDREAVNAKIEVNEFMDLADANTAQDVPFSSLVFHPGYMNPDSNGFGCFYAIVPEKKGAAKVDFIPEFADTEEHHQDVLVEFKTEMPEAEVFNGERRELLRLSQPGLEHNMAGLAFDLRGHLFVAVGDGAQSSVGKNSPSRNAMSLSNPYGKVLRIDPLGNNSQNGKYGLPKRNPLTIIDSALPEIWCYGLRTPRSLQFDPFRKWLCIGDSGKENLEEINISEYGGEHFGWDLCEGSFFFPPSEGARPTEGVTAPHVEFARKSDSVVGGFIYRGERFPILSGRMVVATTKGRLLAAKARPEKAANELQLISAPDETEEDLLTHSVNAIRPGPGGEIFILTSGGSVFELHKPVSAATSKRNRKPLLAGNY